MYRNKRSAAGSGTGDGDDIMITYTDLVEMLPEFFAQILEYPEIMKAWAEGLRMGENNIQHLWDNLYLQTCDEGTIEYWEDLLGLFPAPGDTLEVRRNRILNMFSLTRPYTERSLRARLDEMYGAGNYTLNIDSQAETADMQINVHINQGILLFCDLWLRIAPAHMAMTVKEDVTTDVDGFMYFGGAITSSRFVTIQ